MGLQLIDYRPGPYTDHGPATLAQPGTSPYWVTINADGHFEVNGTRLKLIGDHLIETACGLDTNAEVDGLCQHAAAPGINYVRMMGWNNKPRTSVKNGCFLYFPWRADVSISTNEYCTASGNVYKRVSGSTTGTTIPSGTGATINDGVAVWAYQATLSPAPSTINDYYDEDTGGFLEQMDRTIADLNSRGIRVWFSFENGDKPRMIEGLAPNTSNGSADNRRAYADHGMMWSDTWNDMYERHISYMLNRVNTTTGVAYKDNPMLSFVQAFNENSFWNACTLTSPFSGAYSGYCMMDFIVNSTGGSGAGLYGGSGWWLPELEAHWQAWATLNGVTWPQATFPKYEEWVLNSGGLWNSTFQAHMVNYIKDTDVAAAQRYETFIKSIMPNVVYTYVENRYMDPRVGNYQDCGSLHCYDSEGIAAGSDTTSRKSILDGTTGWASVLSTGGLWSPRITNQPYVITEGPGQYSRNRNDFETEPIRATMAALQDIDGLTQFCIWQNSFYSSAAGNTTSGSAHYTAVWPSRRLSWLFSGKIFEWGLVGPITTESAMNVQDSGMAARIVSDGFNIRQTGQEVAVNAGVANTVWSWLKRQLSTTYTAAATDYSTDTSIATADLVTGVDVVTATGTTHFRGAGYASPIMKWDHDGIIGCCVTVDNGTYGSVGNGQFTISGLSAPFRGICAMRTNSNSALAAGDVLFVLHGATFQTDMTVAGSAVYPTNFNTFIGGDLNTYSGGTDANTRLIVPDPVSVVVDLGAEYLVYGLTASGLATSVTGTLISSTWNSGAGTVSFTTDSNYPAYYLELVPTSYSPAGTTMRGQAPKRKRFHV